MTDIIKKLKVCVRWYQQVDETHVQEKENLRSSLESAEKRYSDKGDFSFLYILSSHQFVYTEYGCVCLITYRVGCKDQRGRATSNYSRDEGEHSVITGKVVKGGVE